MQRWSDALHLGVAGLVVAAALALALYAGFSRQALYADGPHYFVLTVESGRAVLTATARDAANMIQNVPLAAAASHGLGTIHQYVVGYSLWLALIPALGLLGACLVVPRRHRRYLVFPIAYYVAGWASSGFVLILESAVATAWFWILFLLLLFRLERRASFAIFAALALPAMFMHQVYAFLAPILAAAAVWRCVRAESAWQRRAFAVIALWFVAVAAVQVGYTLFPHSRENADGFFTQLFAFRWLEDTSGHIHRPAAVSVVVLGALAVAGLASFASRAAWARVTMIAAAIFAFAAALSAVPDLRHFDENFYPIYQFHSRAQSAFVSAALAVVALLSRQWPRWERSWAIPGLPLILAVLAVFTLGWQTSATERWARYLDLYERILASHRGLVPWAPLLKSLAAGDASIMDRMDVWWTQPSMSFALSRDGKVATIIANRTGIAWQPIDPVTGRGMPGPPRFDPSLYWNAMGGRPQP